MSADPSDTLAWFLIRRTTDVLPPGMEIWFGGLATVPSPTTHVAE